MNPEKISVLGGGTWGCTLANHLAVAGHDVSIWEYDPVIAKKLKESRALATLPQLHLPDSIMVTNDIAEAVQDRPVVISVTPSHTVRATFREKSAQNALLRGVMVISASKGLETETNYRMSEIIKEVFTKVGDIVILSGPSHAEEVAEAQPVALVAASHSVTATKHVRDLFTTERFRIYTSEDPIGVEFGGAIKNIYAVACGIIDGLKLGDNTKAALMSRGLIEMTRIGKTLGAQAKTFFGLSGLGDLIVTCGSKHSRNRGLGELIGQGKTLKQSLSEMTMVAEGVKTTQSVHQLVTSRDIDAPIIEEMYQVLFENKSPRDSIKDLMSRPAGAEMEGIEL